MGNVERSAPATTSATPSCAPARRHASRDAASWTDLDGWERRHELLTPRQLDAAPLGVTQRAFLGALAASPYWHP